jgi:hypothetical protein
MRNWPSGDPDAFQCISGALIAVKFGNDDIVCKDRTFPVHDLRYIV